MEKKTLDYTSFSKIITTYLRSSSYNTFTSHCEHKYFLEYVLGFDSPTGKAACKGTMAHKVLELLALAKKAKSQGKSSFKDEFGRLSVDFDVEKITSKVFNHYKKQEQHLSFTAEDLRDVSRWVKKARTIHDGLFDPLNRDIIAAEQFFDFEIQEPWAFYDFKIGENNFKGNLRVRGTIDLITQLDEKTLEIIDWKTGAYRTVFPTKQLKDQKYFETDTQLQIYFWAISQLYPQYENVLITIYYINAGGPFTVMFHKHQIPEILNKLQKTFKNIVNTAIPAKNIGWHCKICPHQYGNCEKIHKEIYQIGINKVTEKYFNPDKFGIYKNPGE